MDVSAPDSPTTLAEIPADAANAVAVFDSLALVAAGEELLVVPPRCTTADTTDSEPPDPEDPDAEPGVGVYYLRVVTNERTMVQSVVVAR